MEDYARFLSRGIRQLGFESSLNHLASVAAGPTSEIKLALLDGKTDDAQYVLVTNSRLPQMKLQE